MKKLETIEQWVDRAVREPAAVIKPTCSWWLDKTREQFQQQAAIEFQARLKHVPATRRNITATDHL